MKKVMLFGTFNVIHPGHLNLFRQARKFGDELYVVLARDETVARLKGYHPRKEIIRMKNLMKIPLIDHVILGDFYDRFKAVKQIKPDIICLGYDQTYFVDELEAYLEENDLDTIIVRLKPYYPEKYKDSKFREQKENTEINKNNNKKSREKKNKDKKLRKILNKKVTNKKSTKNKQLKKIKIR